MNSCLVVRLVITCDFDSHISGSNPDGAAKHIIALVCETAKLILANLPWYVIFTVRRGETEVTTIEFTGVV